ncbi:DUF2232 domain-containing protein [Hathewaya limosa]|uniref:Uncharacterized protein YybS (DUF2232 family) n=1 Tax=Hathewaya limosa TaxID=1536 RepID=A0ABU0JNV6_HATLI|nr:DUF2232 domain-containing protein [Hathewaya limosa]MDQ0478724.1 uncharacterized protein YybS (DUF2232 family) [Hathewaya limosa]
MVKRIWSSNKNVESFVVIFLSMLVMFISAASIDINLLGIFLLPIPIMLLCLKFNWKISVLIIGISSVINIFTYGVSGTLSAILVTAIIGITFAYCIENEFSSVNIVKTVIAISFVLLILNVLLYTSINNVSIVEHLNKIVKLLKDQIDNMIITYKQVGVGNSNIDILVNFKDFIDVKVVLGIIPTMILGYCIVFNTINYVIIEKLLRNSNIKPIKRVGFRHFYISNLLGALLVGLVSIAVILNVKKFAIGEFLELSLISITDIIMIINGMATITYLLRKKLKKSRGLVIIILLLLINLGFQQILFYIGFTEMLFDFRRLDPYSLRKKKKEV